MKRKEMVRRRLQTSPFGDWIVQSGILEVTQRTPVVILPPRFPSVPRTLALHPRLFKLITTLPAD
jgi:hypothetical protein